MTPVPFSRLAMIAVLIALCGCAVAGEKPVYQVTGPGGGGGICSCNGSPVDPNFMLCCCDMGGCYRSDDGGKTWELIPYLQIMSSANESRPFFHGKDANIVVWRAWITKDQGRTWKPVADPVRGPWGTFEKIVHVACSADAKPELYVGSATGVWVSTNAELYISNDAGDWRKDEQATLKEDAGRRETTPMLATLRTLSLPG